MAKQTRTGGREATDAVIPGRIALSVGRPSLPEPPGFKWRRLSDVARLESGHTPSRSKKEYCNGDIPWKRRSRSIRRASLSVSLRYVADFHGSETVKGACARVVRVSRSTPATGSRAIL